MKNMKKSVAILLAVVLLVGAVIGGTLAWFTDKTQEVKNTFTIGNIDIDLEETKEEFHMIPGWTIDKDPVVSVEEGSEDVLLFVEVTSNNTITEAKGVYSVGEYLEYQIAAGWNKLEGKNNVFYRTVKKTDTERAFSVLLGDEVQVKDTVTKDMMDNLTAEPTLTFQAYAIQLKNSNTTEFDAAAAWAELKG